MYASFLNNAHSELGVPIMHTQTWSIVEGGVVKGKPRWKGGGVGNVRGMAEGRVGKGKGEFESSERCKLGQFFSRGA